LAANRQCHEYNFLIDARSQNKLERLPCSKSFS
jgi:hypothetical protein